MTHRVEWTPPARRDIARLPPNVALAVMTYVDSRLAENPRRLSKTLTGELENVRAARNGDYRILFHLDDDPLVIWITAIDHRAHVYRSR